ncbi:MAG: hypothetical protein M0017_02850 [Desulfobacteraceae bacterium]|nr:hypothetical protein [Desulfobacteraceae bacterium]
MIFRSFEEALHICLTAESGSPEQDEALVYCMEHAPGDLKELLRQEFVHFHTGAPAAPGHEHGNGCGCSDHQRKPSLSDFIK